LRFIRAILNKPWDHQGEMASAISGDMMSVSTSPQQLALNLFLAVASVLFALFGIAYFMRMAVDTSSPLFCGAGYWEVLQEPDLLWLNTGVLVLTSGVIEWTKRESRANRLLATKIGLSVGALLTLAFLYGQSAAWGILHQSGHLVDSSAASSFFYLLTGLHALHVIGGLWVWLSATMSAFLDRDEPQRIGETVRLCAVYWHYLLLLWALLFTLFLNT
jgi:cytochrome c oxidase subunit 3